VLFKINKTFILAILKLSQPESLNTAVILKKKKLSTTFDENFIYYGSSSRKEVLIFLIFNI